MVPLVQSSLHKKLLLFIHSFIFFHSVIVTFVKDLSGNSLICLSLKYPFTVDSNVT